MSTSVNLEDHEDELKFQEFPLTPEPPRRSSKNLHDDFVEFGNAEEQEELLKEDTKPKPSFVEFSYYQSFCNVDTSQVLQRILWSMVPASGRNTFLNQHIKSNPDLYGPFWISVTLVFSIAISSNIADYLSSAGRTNRIWHYDFHKVTIAAITIFSYIFFIPLLLWTLLRYNTVRGVRYTFLEILCVYGYSIFIYIPISILWVIQIPALQWLLVIAGALLSGSVLVKNFWPALRHTNIKIGMLVLSLILLFHTLLAASFVLYFFKPSPRYGEDIQPLSINPVVPAAQENMPSVDFEKLENKVPIPNEKVADKEKVGEDIISTVKDNAADNPLLLKEKQPPKESDVLQTQDKLNKNLPGDKPPPPPKDPSKAKDAINQLDPQNKQTPKINKNVVEGGDAQHKKPIAAPPSETKPDKSKPLPSSSLSHTSQAPKRQASLSSGATSPADPSKVTVKKALQPTNSSVHPKPHNISQDTPSSA